MVMRGNSGQYYGLQSKIGSGAYGDVYNAIRLEKKRNGRFKPMKVQDALADVPLVVKLMKY